MSGWDCPGFRVAPASNDQCPYERSQTHREEGHGRRSRNWRDTATKQGTLRATISWRRQTPLLWASNLSCGFAHYLFSGAFKILTSMSLRTVSFWATVLSLAHDNIGVINPWVCLEAGLSSLRIRSLFSYLLCVLSRDVLEPGERRYLRSIVLIELLGE